MANDPVRALAERAKALLEQRQTAKHAKTRVAVSPAKATDKRSTDSKQRYAIACGTYDRRVRDRSLPKEILAKLARELSLVANERIVPPSDDEWLADAVILTLRLRPLMVRVRNQNELWALFCREVACAAVELRDCDPAFYEYLEEEYFPETLNRAFSRDDPEDCIVALWCAVRVVIPRILRSFDEEYGLGYECDSSVDPVARQLAAARAEVRRRVAKTAGNSGRQSPLPPKSPKEKQIERDHAAELRRKRASVERYLQSIDVNSVENGVEWSEP